MALNPSKGLFIWSVVIKNETSWWKLFSPSLKQRFTAVYSLIGMPVWFLKEGAWFIHRSSHQRCSTKKVSLQNSQNSKEIAYARVSFLIKLQACNFIKKDTLALVFSFEFCEFLQNTSGWLLLHLVIQWLGIQHAGSSLRYLSLITETCAPVSGKTENNLLLLLFSKTLMRYFSSINQSTLFLFRGQVSSACERKLR